MFQILKTEWNVLIFYMNEFFFTTVLLQGGWIIVWEFWNRISLSWNPIFKIISSCNMTNFDLHTCRPTDADLWGNLLKKDGCVWLAYPSVVSICLALKPTFLTLPGCTAEGIAYRRNIRFYTRIVHCDWYRQPPANSWSLWHFFFSLRQERFRSSWIDRTSSFSRTF